MITRKTWIMITIATGAAVTILGLFSNTAFGFGIKLKSKYPSKVLSITIFVLLIVISERGNNLHD